jgi:hypothetical protein
LHYAFLGDLERELGMVANVAFLGPAHEDPRRSTRCTSILLLHDGQSGWRASQFNAETLAPLWSAFRRPHAHGASGRLELGSTAGRVNVALDLVRTSRPCTAQTAPFARRQFLRWQSETGVIARGRWQLGTRVHEDVEAIGYHERVRGYWGWPELGSWVFGFANDPVRDARGAPETALVFTLIQPAQPADAMTGSVKLWRKGRFVRHFGRRGLSVAVDGRLARDRVTTTPALADLLGVGPMASIPARLVVRARQGQDEVVLDFAVVAAARVVIPNETGLRPFSVHEVIGRCRVEGVLGGRAIGFEALAIVEFAGGAGAD